MSQSIIGKTRVILLPGSGFPWSQKNLPNIKCNDAIVLLLNVTNGIKIFPDITFPCIQKYLIERQFLFVNC